MPSPWRMAAIINSTESVYIVITENSTDFAQWQLPLHPENKRESQNNSDPALCTLQTEPFHYLSCVEIKTPSEIRP